MNKCFKKIKIIISYSLLLFWMTVIFAFSAKNAIQSTAQSNIILNIISRLIYIEIEENVFWEVMETIVRKLAHFSIYFILGFLTINAFRYNLDKRLILFSFIFCIVYSVTDEIHQYFVPERACRLFDVIVDTCGSCFGIYLYRRLQKAFSKLSKRSELIEKE